MVYCFSYYRYQRTFAKPLQTARGEWFLREGFVLRAESDFGVGYGEIAPIPEFGTETIVQACAFLDQLVDAPDLVEDAAKLAGLPCCAFGLSAALAGRASVPARDYRVAGLLPAGSAALAQVATKLDSGYRTFKWKIGVAPVDVEQALFRELVAQLPMGARLRLDANGGLSVAALQDWLSMLQDFSEVVEYIEQPLPVGQEAKMSRFAAASRVPVALDESLNGASGTRWLAEWDGPLVVKPALMGDCAALLQCLRPMADRVTLSSVFETAVGLQNALCFADQLPGHKLAIGFDTLAAFTDSLMPFSSAPVIGAGERAQLVPETIWNQLT